MKRLGIGSTALTLLLFGATYSFAQDKPAQHEEENKGSHETQPAKQAPAAQHTEKAAPAQHEEKAAPVQPAEHAQKAPPAQHTEKAPAAETAKRTEPAKTAKPTERTAKTEQVKPAKEPSRTAMRTAPSTRPAENTRTTATTRTTDNPRTSTNTRTEQAHNFGGHGGGHITDARFQASFGNSHRFHMNRPTLYEGYSRFNYGGYYFGFYDPWPSDWGYSDDVYVDYIDGQYFLIDPEHPGPRLMINVVI